VADCILQKLQHTHLEQDGEHKGFPKLYCKYLNVSINGFTLLVNLLQQSGTGATGLPLMGSN
jgi:hypothetical protein